MFFFRFCFWITLERFHSIHIFFLLFGLDNLQTHIKESCIYLSIIFLGEFEWHGEFFPNDWVNLWNPGKYCWNVVKETLIFMAITKRVSRNDANSFKMIKHKGLGNLFSLFWKFWRYFYIFLQGLHMTYWVIYQMMSCWVVKEMKMQWPMVLIY